VQSDFNVEGQWSSPCGEVKQFTSENYTMKWYGRKKQKLVMIRDDKNESLREKLIKFATLNKVNIHDGEQSGEAEGNPNTVGVIENSVSDDGKYDSDHITANQDDLDSSKIETFVGSGHKFTCSPCYCRDLALQLKCVERDIQKLKNRAETCDGNTRVCNTNTCQSEKAPLRSNWKKLITQ
jgi:ribosomal protein L30E